MLSTAGLGAGHGDFIFYVQKMMTYAHMLRARLPYAGRAGPGFRPSPADRGSCSWSV